MSEKMTENMKYVLGFLQAIFILSLSMLLMTVNDMKTVLVNLEKSASALVVEVETLKTFAEKRYTSDDAERDRRTQESIDRSQTKDILRMYNQLDAIQRRTGREAGR